MSGTSPDTPTPGGHRPSLTALLEQATPERVPPLDLDGLARRGRHRRRRRRAALAGGAAALVALVVGSAVAVTGGDDPAEVGTAQEGPDRGVTLTEPVGSWVEATDPPFSPRAGAFGGALSDGRVLVWGGDSSMGDEGSPRPLDGGIYDPDTGQWSAIPEAPLPVTDSGSSSKPSAQLAGDRLAVVAEGAGDAGITAAVYDVAEGQWHVAPEQDAITFMYDTFAWDGETLALLRLDPGGLGYTEDLPEGDAGPPAGEPDLDFRVDAPVTLRWTVGESDWQEGAPSPLGLRAFAGTAFDGLRLAVWGGTSSTRSPDELSPGPDPDARADGAIYDVSADRWQPIADGPLSGRIHPGVAWSEGRLLIGGGTDRRLCPCDDFPDLMAYDPATGRWEELEGPPQGGIQVWPAVEHVAGRPQLVRAGASWEEVGPGEEWPDNRWFLGDDGWETAPSNDLHQLGDVLAATTSTGDNPGDSAFGVQVRAGQDRWLDSAEAPFANRMSPTIVPTGDQLLVVGGADRHLQTIGDAWVFDLGTVD